MDPSTLCVVALCIAGYAVVSRLAEDSPITPPIFFVGAGLLLYGLGIAPERVDDTPLHFLAELTLILVLFSDASRIDLACLRRERSIPVRLLSIGMPLTLALGGAVAFGLLPGLSLYGALLLAAILTPTDAALGQAVVTSPDVPVRIRQSLNVESGLNDGIALPAVLVLASLAGAAESEGDAGAWTRFALLQVTLGPLVGAATGHLGGRLLAAARNAGRTTPSFERLAVLSFAVFAFGGAELVGGNGFISTFVAGLAIGNTARAVCHSLIDFAETEGQLLTLLVFVLFGAVLLPQGIAHATPMIVLYALLSLTVVRMLPVALSLLGAQLRWQSVAFLAWFGPRGLASILFALLVVEEQRMAYGETFEAVVVTTVALSTLLHGVTAVPFARAYGRFTRQLADEHAEHEAAMELPTRVRHGRIAKAAGGPR